MYGSIHLRDRSEVGDVSSDYGKEIILYVYEFTRELTDGGVWNSKVIVGINEYYENSTDYFIVGW